MVVSFIIRTKNEENDIGRTCECILAQQGQFDKEIVIIDSGSTDNTLEIARMYTNNVIELKPEDFTWGYAINKGISCSRGDFIFILSAHCFLSNKLSISNGLNYVITKNLNAVYGRQIGDKKKDICEYAELFYEYPIIKYEESNWDKVHGISNACCLLTRKSWEECKFDESLQSAEDADWYNKGLQRGYKFGYSSDIEIIHGHRYSLIYVYKKTFWREYICIKLIGDKKYGIKQTITFTFLSRLANIIIYYRKYAKALKIAGIHYSKSIILKYVITKNIASFSARRFNISNRNLDMRYEDIRVPKIIHKFNGR